MSIKKMLLVASMALAAIAFAAPAVAQADVFLTDPENVKLEKGAKVTATSSNLQTHTAETTLTCNKVTLHFVVLTNGPEHVELQQLGEATTKECELDPFGLPVTITDGTVGDEDGILTINTWGHGEAPATFTSDVFLDAEHTELAQSCHYTGNVTLQAEKSGGDIINVPGSTLTETEELCPDGEITGDLTLETSDDPETPETDEVPVYIDFDETG